MSTTTGWLGKLKKLLQRTDEKTISRVEVLYDAGFGNTLFIRGSGSPLSWEKGVSMKNVSSDLWAWETDDSLDNCRFKVLINDVQYEEGEDHLLTKGAVIRYSPKF